MAVRCSFEWAGTQVGVRVYRCEREKVLREQLRVAWDWMQVVVRALDSPAWI